MNRSDIIQLITDEAQRLGVPVNLALAIAQQESGLDPASIGDNGHSIGLFQLNDQGEGHGLTVAQREDPATNIRIALTQVANVMRTHPELSGGQLAAAAQRPADRAAYAQAVDAGLGRWQTVSGGPGGGPVQVQENASYGSGGTLGSSPTDLPSLMLAAGIPPQWVNDPQIGPLLKELNQPGGISFDEFKAQASQTQIYKTTPQSQRIAEVSQAADPSTLAQRIQQNALSIHNQASKKGIALTPAQELSLATQENANNWTQEQLDQQLAAHITSTGQATGGEAATDLSQLRGIYKDYQVPVNDNQLNGQLQQILSGAQTLQGFQSALANQAKVLYSNNPQLAKNIDANTSTMAVLNPYITKAAGELGIDSNTIDPSSPQWSFLTKPTTDPTTGQTTGNMLSLDDVVKKVQLDPVFGYFKTPNGISAAQTLSDSIDNAFSGGARVQ